METCETVPVSLLGLQGGHTEELINGVFWVVGLHLLGVVVLVFDIDVSTLLVIFVLVFEVVAGDLSVCDGEVKQQVARQALTLPDQSPA